MAKKHNLGTISLHLNLLFLSKFCCLGHNVCARNARKPIKGSKDLDYSLLTNIYFDSQNIGSCSWGPGPDDLLLRV